MLTKVKLAYDLKAHGAPGWMVRAAIDGHYDDFESDIATPLMQLVADCERLVRESPGQWENLRTIAAKAKEGEYDGTAQEADAWLQGEQGQASLEELGEAKKVLFPDY